jgi:hypothetical protein
MLTRFPKAVPEIPVSNLRKPPSITLMCSDSVSIGGNDEGGIGGISQGACRMFLTNTRSAEIMLLAGRLWFG